MVTTRKGVTPMAKQMDLLPGFEFKDEEFMTAEDKGRVLQQWERFLRNGLRWEDFTDRLYKHLSLHCSFIAHYDRAGFYSVYFTSGDGKRAFLAQFDNRNAGPEGVPKSTEIGMTYWARGAYEDINLAMIEVGSTYIPQLEQSSDTEQRRADIAQATALLGKHNIDVGDLI